MRKLLLVIIMTAMGCNYDEDHEKYSKCNMEAIENNKFVPEANQWVTSPLRNRLELELKAPLSEVWALVGDPARMPEYSNGLREVDAEKDSTGNCLGYTCFFKPPEEAQPEVIHHSAMKWYEKNKGWASLDDKENPFGLLESLSLMTLKPQDNGTIFTWEFYFNCQTAELLKFNQEGYRTALDDISQRLLKRFGGRVLKNQVL